MDLSSKSSSSVPLAQGKPDISKFALEPFAALEELKRRRKDGVLMKVVEDSLDGDIPPYMRAEPILYLARHLITPNFETLRFVHLIADMGVRCVVTHDSKSLFVSQNCIKRALCKLPICKRVTQTESGHHEQYQKLTIVDFNTADGKVFSDIKTLWGESIVEFHIRLFRELTASEVAIWDDAEWIDRHRRDDLLEHYKRLLSLFVAHGIFYENYNLNDAHEIAFIKTILEPACAFVEERFGYAPLIVPIFPTEPESYDFWISYPRKVQHIVSNSMNTKAQMSS